MKEPIGYILHGEFKTSKSDFNNVVGAPEPTPVYSQTQISETFETLKKRKEVPFRHTVILDWDVVKDEFEKFGIK